MIKSAAVIMLLLVLLIAGCGGQNSAQTQTPPGVASIEIGFLNHSPVRNVLNKVDDLLGKYGERVQVTRYDLSTPEGSEFVKDRDLTGHVPLVIFINGSMESSVGGRTVKFYSFPQGEGTGMVADGAWSIEDLRQALDGVVGGDQ